MLSKKSIAVLPFRNLSVDDDNEFFCDGITEEIIDALSAIDGLRVISRISSFYFKDHKQPLTEISEKLQVSNIIEGSVKVQGDMLRIKAQLINVNEDEVLWSNSWDRRKNNIFEIQDEISVLIADRLREHYGHLEVSDQLVSTNTTDVSAYEHLLKGRYHFNKWNPKDIQIAIEQFEQCVSIDPKLIDGYLGIADSYSFLAVAGFAPNDVSWKKAMDAMESAKRIDSNHAGLNYMLCHQAFFTAADYSESIRYCQQSIASKPTYSEAHQYLSFLYLLREDISKAKEHLYYAKALDPLNSETLFFEANYLYRTGKYDEALQILNDLLEENEKNLPAIAVYMYVLLTQNKPIEAEKFIHKIPQETFTPDEYLGLLILIDIYKNSLDSRRLAQLEENAKQPTAHHAHSYLFTIYTNLGRFDDAFEILQQLFESKSPILLLAFSDPMSAAIRLDPRYSRFFDQIYRIEEQKTAPKKSKSRGLDETTAKKLVEDLNAYVQTERPYLNPSLTLRSLGEQIEMHPNQLSWLINEYMGINFNEFINKNRIEHFKRIVLDPDNSHISIVGLAFESGFNSKTVFNTTFKKLTGMTPKEYQKSQS